ncbi:MAG: 2-amino-4-hydroxy-6-hydroxymethyldihydropteridine diphosphokinase [Limisphaerales bacterium]
MGGIGRSENPSHSAGAGAPTAFIALGSNLGNSKSNVINAIDRLRQLSDLPLAISSLWLTSPVDCPSDSPPFVNAVIGMVVRSGEHPESLLLKLQEIEKEFGRRPKQVLNEARPLDLDLIAFGTETRATRELILPHPRAHLRRFVLQPLSEILPDFIFPGQSQSVSELLACLPEDPTIRRLVPD